MKRTIKIRGYPTKKQAKKAKNAQDWLGTIFNQITEYLLECDDADELLPQFFYWYGIIKDMFPSRELETPSTAINAVCNAQKDRIRKVILDRKRGKAARPRFHSRIKDSPITMESDGKSIKLKGRNKITMSGFPAGIKVLEKGADLKQLFKNKVSYSRFGYDKAGKFYINIVYENETKALPKTNKACSIDIGSKTNVALLTKEKVKDKGIFYKYNIPLNKDLTKKIESKQRKYSKQVERKKNEIKEKTGRKPAHLKSKDHSYRMLRTLGEISNLLSKDRRKRHDWLHKLSTKIVKEHDVVCVETLSIKGMTHSRKGSKESPGKMVAQKKGFNSKFLKFAPSFFIGMLEYKCEMFGRKFIKLPQSFPSTKMCSRCNSMETTTNLRLNLSVRVFKCKKCGFSCDRDENACQNLIKSAF